MHHVVFICLTNHLRRNLKNIKRDTQNTQPKNVFFRIFIKMYFIHVVLVLYIDLKVTSASI